MNNSEKVGERKPVYFSNKEPKDLKLKAFAEEQGNFTQYVKKLITEDMQKTFKLDDRIVKAVDDYLDQNVVRIVEQYLKTKKVTVAAEHESIITESQKNILDGMLNLDD